MCLDIGDKRIGVAVTDPFCEYALPVETYVRKNLKADVEKILFYIKQKCATALVCGLPVMFDGTPSVQTKKAQFFIDKIKEATDIEIYSVDERCTTVEAEESLIEQGFRREERKKYVDSLAACSILEGFLSEYNKNKKTRLLKEITMSDKEKKLHHDDCDCGCHEKHIHDEECDCEECADGCDCEECADGCDCGCEDDIVELTTDDGKKLKFYFVGTIEYKGKNYSAFEPAEEIDGISEDDLIIFELAGDDEETADLLPIEDEKLLDEVFEEFCKVLDEEEE